MDAVVLVGGEGTRLRPLTLERPKPVLPLLGRPLLEYVLERLAAGRRHARHLRLRLSPGPDSGLLRRARARPRARIRGRAAADGHGRRHPARGARAHLRARSSRSTATCSPMRRSRSSWRCTASAAASATIALSRVDDPSRYGLVRTTRRPRARLPREARARGDRHRLINAGAYVLEPSVLDLVEEGRAVSIEREMFPSLIGAGLLRCAQPGYWSDVGTPESYIAAHHDLLAGRIRSQLPGLGAGRALDRRRRDGLARACSRRRATSRRGRRRGGRTRRSRQLGGGGRADRGGAQLRGAVVQERASVGEGAVVEDAVIGPRAQIGAGARIGSGAVVGPGVSIAAGATVAAGERVFPEGGAWGRDESLRGDVRAGRPARRAAARGPRRRPGRAGRPRAGPPHSATISALGGSAIGGSLAEALWRDSCARPSVVNRAAGLPGWVGPAHSSCPCPTAERRPRRSRLRARRSSAAPTSSR